MHEELRRVYAALQKVWREDYECGSCIGSGGYEGLANLTGHMSGFRRACQIMGIDIESDIAEDKNYV